MDFGMSKMQKLLVESAEEFLEKESIDLARDMEKTELGYSRDFWKKMADLGWMGILFPEEYGGVGGDFLELVLVVEKMGSALVPGPFVDTTICGYSVYRYGSARQKEELLPKIVDGRLILSPAFIRPDASIVEERVEEHVRVKEGHYILSGTRLFVPFGHVADWYIYGSNIEKEKTVFLIDAESPGVSSHSFEAIGGDKPSEIVLDGCEVPKKNVLGNIGEGGNILREINAWGALAYSAYILGMLEKVLEMTIRYAKKREQFGRPIGSFQAIQHQCADMATEVDRVRFLTYQAAWNLSAGTPATREISMAKSAASDASRKVCLLGVKIHGGIGISEDYDLQLFFRRAKAAELAFGDGTFHREIIASELGL